MATDRFETIPAWRITRLRAALADAERRGADPTDAGDDLGHPALIRRFALGRARRSGTAAVAPRTTRKGRRFPAAKQLAIWRAILRNRPPGWQQGDKAERGRIRRAHAEAVEDCLSAGLPPPRYRTVYVLWHRGRPSAEIDALLNAAPGDHAAARPMANRRAPGLR
jgi:hypothetical protein